MFTSDFLAHLPSREAITVSLTQRPRCLRPGGRLVCLDPNIKDVGGAYWDSLEHLVPLTEHSLVEVTERTGVESGDVIARFLPFTMAGGPTPPSR